ADHPGDRRGRRGPRPGATSRYHRRHGSNPLGVGGRGCGRRGQATTLAHGAARVVADVPPRLVAATPLRAPARPGLPRVPARHGVRPRRRPTASPRGARLSPMAPSLAGGHGEMSRALVLNATYEPLCVVPARRAVVLVLAEKADIVHETDRRLH